MDKENNINLIVKNNLEAYEQIAGDFADKYFSAQLTEEVNRFSKYLTLNSAVIDIGCGVGRDLVLLSSKGFRSIGLDISTAMLQVARNREVWSPLVIGDMRCLPISSKSIDGSWACASLLHFPKLMIRPILSEIARITRSVIFISVIEGAGVRWSKEKDGKSRFFCYYQVNEIVDLIQEAGIGVKEVWIKENEGYSKVRWINIIASA